MQEVNPFFKAALDAVPRFFCQLNRNTASRSHGSFDRHFWHYRTNDISNARKQEGLYTLALLYARDFPGNVFYQNAEVRALINAAVSFTLGLQHRDGSFDEWYINEGSFVATSFLICALSEAMLLLGENDIVEYARARRAVEKGAARIAKETESLVFNQTAGAAAALYNAYLVTGSDRWKHEAQRKIEQILEAQHAEGWWSEYGGPDIGYLSLMIEYLSRYYEKTGDERVLRSIKKATVFLVNFLHPNWTSGGEYMSRNTEYLIPSGFFRVRACDKNADIITQFIARSLGEESGFAPRNLDDTYICYLLYNWIEAGIMGEQRTEHSFDIAGFLHTRTIDHFFPACGIRVLAQKNFYAAINLYKGASLRLYVGGKPYCDSGIEVRDGKRRYSAGVLDYKNEACSDTTRVVSSGALKPIEEPLMKTPVMLAFKLFSLLFGRFRLLQFFVRRFLRSRLILRSATSGKNFTRTIEFLPSEVRITDRVTGTGADARIIAGSKSSYTFVPSSKYFTFQDAARAVPETRETRKGGSITMVRSLTH